MPRGKEETFVGLELARPAFNLRGEHGTLFKPSTVGPTVT